MLLKVTISFALFLSALSKFSSASCCITRPSSCEYCHNFTSPLPSPFLILFSLWLSLVLLKVTISSFRFASCVHRHARLHHTPSHHQHRPISPPFSIPSYFAFSPTLFHSYLIGPIHIKPLVALFVFCLLVHRANEAHQHYLASEFNSSCDFFLSTTCGWIAFVDQLENSCWVITFLILF